MRRTPAPSSSTTSSTKSLGLSSFHERYRILEEKHQWLLKQIEKIRNFVRDFRDKKITIKEFLRGPMHDEEMLEMMLGQLLGVKI